MLIVLCYSAGVKINKYFFLINIFLVCMCEATEMVNFFFFFFFFLILLRCFDSGLLRSGSGQRPNIRELRDDNYGMVFPCPFTWWFLIQELSHGLSGRD